MCAIVYYRNYNNYVLYPKRIFIFYFHTRVVCVQYYICTERVILRVLYSQGRKITIIASAPPARAYLSSSRYYTREPDIPVQLHVNYFMPRYVTRTPPTYLVCTDFSRITTPPPSPPFPYSTGQVNSCAYTGCSAGTYKDRVLTDVIKFSFFFFFGNP